MTEVKELKNTGSVELVSLSSFIYIYKMFPLESCLQKGDADFRSFPEIFYVQFKSLLRGLNT